MVCITGCAYPTTSARILAPLAWHALRTLYYDSCAFAHNETISVLIKWDGCFFTSSVVFNAVKEVKPATPIGVILASVPPATITSASPCWIERNASPMECVPVAHAVTTLMHFPLRPNWMETFPAAMLLIINGTNNGSTLPGPFLTVFFSLRSKACKEPIPEPTLTPTRKDLLFPCQCLMFPELPLLLLLQTGRMFPYGVQFSDPYTVLDQNLLLLLPACT